MRIVLAVSLAVFAAAPVRAFDKADLARFLATGSCPGCDLADAWLDPAPEVVRAAAGGDLSGADLRGAMILFDPSGFNMRGADLRETRAFYTAFDGTDLTGAVLSGLQTYGTLFDGAILRGADLSDTGFDASFIGADLTGADLSGASFSALASFTAEQLAVACGDDSTTLPLDVRLPPCE